MLFDPPPLADLQTAFAGRLAETRESTIRYLLLDTFDWRLWNAGCTLSFVHDGDRDWLVFEDGGAPYRAPAFHGPPGFVDEVTSPRLASRLAGPVGIRRLLPIIEIETREMVLPLLDERDKTVVRMVLREGVARMPPGAVSLSPDAPQEVELQPSLAVRPLRGYDDEARRALLTLEEDLGLAPQPGNLRQRALAAVGRRPGDYTSKLRLTLEPGVSAGAALRQVLAYLLDTVRRNEDGARGNVDPEFLHDLRVAVRRTRSALAQLKGVLDPAAVKRLQAELKWLGRLTGPVRDLDVQRLHLPEYRANLLPEEAQALDPLESFLCDQHAIHRRELVTGLDSPRYRKLLADWQGLVDSPPGGVVDGPLAEEPAVDVVRERIAKLQKKVLKKGKKMGDAASMPALHRLRIDCKKLRYMLELFRSLFVSEEIGAAIKRLRRLQNTLGNINDLDVQQHNLRTYSDAMAEEGIADAATLLIIGRMVERMASRQEKQRRRFAKRFRTFADQARRHPVGDSLAARATDS